MGNESEVIDHGSKKESSKEEKVADPACEADLYQMITW